MTNRKLDGGQKTGIFFRKEGPSVKNKTSGFYTEGLNPFKTVLEVTLARFLSTGGFIGYWIQKES